MTDRDRVPMAERATRIAIVSWAAIGVSVLIAGSFWLLGRISSVLVPFIFAALVVFLLRRPVSKLTSRGLSRGAAVSLCYLLAALIVTFAVMFVVPPLVAQFREFFEAFPGYYESASQLWFDLQLEYTSMEIPAWVQDAVFSARDSITSSLTDWSRSIATGVFSVGGQLVNFVVNVFLALALAFFVLKDLPQFKEEFLRLGGTRRRDTQLEILGRITTVIEGWLRGQSLVALIVGVLTWLGLQVLGVPYALIIGIIAGLTNLIPYLGPLVGGSIAAISAAFVSPQLVIYTIIWIVVLQQAEGLFLQPRIMSDQVNLHPVLVMFALLVGAQTAGLLGMLFAVPVAGVASTLFVYYFEKNTSSELATEQGALFRKTRQKCQEDPESPECDQSDEENV